MATDKSITKTGPMSYRDLQKANQELYNSTSADTKAFLEDLNKRYAPVSTYDPYSHATQLVQSSLNDTDTPWGESMFDSRTATEEQFRNLGDIRADNQPWYAQIGAGLAKGTILAGTTFLDGTIGLLFGTVEAIRRGELAGLWDNDFSRAMKEINDAAEKALPNYYTQEELNSPWYTQIGTANFIGDKFIKNLGFSVGALYSGGITSGALKATRLPELLGFITKSTSAPKIVTSSIGAVTSAVNEGRIEALNNSEDWKNQEIAKLDNNWAELLNEKYANIEAELAEEYKAALDEYEKAKGNLVPTREGGYKDPALERYKQKLADIEYKKAYTDEIKQEEWENRTQDPRYRSTLNKIHEDQLKMGNVDMLLNLPILTASNLVQFTKFYARGYDTARRAGVRSTGNIIDGTIEYTGKKATNWGRAGAISKGFLSEANEEASQKVVSVIPGNYYSTDVSNWYKSQIDPDAEQETLSWIKATATGINDAVNDGSTWEEWFIGGMTGLLGIPTFRSIRNSEGKIQSPIKLEGGAWNEIKEYNERIATSQKNAEYLNSRVKSPEFLNYYRGLIRHNKYQNDMNNAAEAGDPFNFKNAEHDQWISDIIMFDNAGKLEDLKTFIEFAHDTSDENLQAIIEKTTSVGENRKKIGPFVDKEGNPMTATEEGKQEMIEKLNESKKSMLDSLNRYRKIKNNMDIMTGGALTNEQLAELTWMKSRIEDWESRAKQMTPEIKEIFGKIRDSFTAVRDSFIESTSKEYDGSKRDKQGIKAAEQQGYKQIYIDRLNQLISMSDKALRNALANPINSIIIQDILNSIDEIDEISAEDADKINTLLEDLKNINEGIRTTNEKLKEYLANPEKITEDNKKTEEEVASSIKNKETADVKTKLSQAQTLKEFREVLNSEQNSEAKKAAIDELESEGNQIAKDFKEVAQYSNDIKRELSTSGEPSQTINDAVKLWNKQMHNTENLNQAAYPNSVTINDEEFFLEDSNNDPNIANTRFQNARYALQKAMAKVNSSVKFRDRFSPEYKQPTGRIVPNGTSNTTGNSGVGTAPAVNSGGIRLSPNGAGGVTINPVPIINPIGDISEDDVKNENLESNGLVETPDGLQNNTTGKKKFYIPTIPELHIGASKEGDFRPFDIVVSEKEPGVDFSGIYSYLRDNGAFDYVNAAKIKAGDTIGFMIDPQYEASKDEAFRSVPTIFIVDTRNNQIIGSLTESEANMSKYEGLSELIKKIRDEYQASRSVNSEEVQYTTTYDTFEDAAIITLTSNGFSDVTERRDWSRNAGDIRTNPDGWGEYNGLTYYKRTIGGREGDNVTIWFRTPLSESGKRKLSKSFDNSTEITDEKKAEILDIINKNQASKEGIISTETSKDRETTITKFNRHRSDGKIYTSGGLSIGKDKITEDSLEALEELQDVQLLELRETDGKYAGTIRGKIGEDGRYTIFGVKFTSNPVENTNLKSSSTEKFYATPQTRVSQVMVGRIPLTEEERSLADIPGVKDSGTQPIFGIVKNGAITTNGKVADNLILKPTNLGNKEGRLYLLIPNAAGTYSPAAVRVKHLNDTEFNLDDVTVVNTPVGRTISEAMEKLADVRSQDDVSSIMRQLQNDLFLRDVIVAYFETENGSTGINIIKKIRKDDGSYEFVNINGNEVIKEEKQTVFFTDRNGNTRDTEEIKKEITRRFQSLNLPLQVDVSKINTPAQNNRLINSNILTSNLREAKVISNWFTMDYFDSEGNAHSAINPASIARISSSSNPISPVGGRENLSPGTVVSAYGQSYTVDFKSNSIINTRTGAKLSWNNSRNAVIKDLAWAQENYGDATESSVMTENKIITPSGRVLDRTTGKYLTGAEEQRVKDKISGRSNVNQGKIAKAKRVETSITENQKKVDRSRTDSEHYYIQEEDGNYYPYDRIHKRIGNNWTNSSSSTTATSAGSAVDSIVREFFVNNAVPERPSNMSEEAFKSLIDKLIETKEAIERRGERFLANNIVLFHKYADGTRIAGEVDILAVDKNGNFKIYDIKTSKWPFGTFIDNRGNTVNYFENKSPNQIRSTKEQYTLQLSGYKNLFESQYGAEVTTLALMPFVLAYNSDIITSITPVKGIPLTYNPSVNVPLDTNGIVAQRPVIERESTAKEDREGRESTNEEELPIFNPTIEPTDFIDRAKPHNAFTDSDGVREGYYYDGERKKVYKGYLKKGGEVEVTYASGQKEIIPIYITKKRDGGLDGTTYSNISEYWAVFPNGNAVMVLNIGTDDTASIKEVVEAVQENPGYVLELISESTPIHNPREAEESSYPISEEPIRISGSASSMQDINAINPHNDEYEDEIDLDDIMKLRESKFSGTRIWNKEKELAWLNKNLPQLSEEDRIKIREGLIEVAKKGVTAWGMFSNGIITLSDIAAEGTAYHEAFHYVFNLLMDASEREALFKEARERWGDKSKDALEEDMAEAFREYTMNRESRGLGRRILDFFKNLFVKATHWGSIKPTMDNYFRAINEGRYANKESVNRNTSSRLRKEEYTPEMNSIKQQAIADGTFMKAPNGKPTNLNERQWLQVRTKNFINWFGDWINDPANASKVVDENGEPLVVYHGSQSKEKFNTFTYKNDTPKAIASGKQDAFFFSNEETADAYRTDRYTDIKYEKYDCFLNIKNPLVLDYEGASFNGKGMYAEGFDVLFNTYNHLPYKVNGKEYKYFPNELQAIQQFRKEYDFNYEITEKDLRGSVVKVKEAITDLVDNIDREKYDGIIINNITEISTPTIDYVAFKPNQIKSATSNNGDFSTTNDDIRYRLVDPASEDNTKRLRKDAQTFLNNFGITLKEMEEDYTGDMPLFDALNRVINFRDTKELTDGVGYAVAFMMQHNATMQEIFKYKLQESNLTFVKGLKKSISKRGDYSINISSKQLQRTLREPEVKDRLLRSISKDIAAELKSVYKLEEPSNSTFFQKLRQIIYDFFNKLTRNARIRFDVIFNYTNNIANSIKLNDPSIVLTRDTKPKTTELPEKVDIERALREFKYEEGIISSLYKEGIALAGSASIALSGTVYRPSENPLHDIDFQAYGFTKEKLNGVVESLSPYYHHVRTIATDGRTETYLILDRPYTLKEVVEFNGDKEVKFIRIHDKETGELLGKYEVNGNDLDILKSGVKGKFLDFFTEGRDIRESTVRILNGKPYLIASPLVAWEAKIRYGRDKDIWDYNRYIPNTFDSSSLFERREQEKKRTTELLRNAKIVWGHPAIGKTHYLERNQDIIEWDQEVNNKRNRFIDNQIDPNHTMDRDSIEFKSMRSNYMINWKNHPEYIDFLTKEWENLKERAIKENKRLFVSASPVLEMALEDFDLIINLPEKTFLQREKQRGAENRLNSMGWKQGINRILTQADPDKVVTTDKYFSEFMRDNLGVQWGTLTEEEELALAEKGWSKETFNRLSQAEKDNVIDCLPL